MNKSVLDASAFLAYLRDETGAEIVENALIDGCYISIINWVGKTFCTVCTTFGTTIRSWYWF